MKPREPKLTFERLKELFAYDPETGVFRRLVNRAKAFKVGDIAGCKNPQGYWWIGIDGTNYYAHRLAWLYMTGEWPSSSIDHIDVDKLNNRWSNLRLATYSENGTNRKIFPNNTSGFKGVSWHKRIKKFAVRISKNRQDHHLGYFDNPQEAHQAYVAASEKYHGKFAREV